MKTEKDFYNLIERYAYNKGGDVLDILESFLEWTIVAFSHNIKHKRSHLKEENIFYMELLRELMLIQTGMLKKYEWYDVFGKIYELSAGKSRRSSKGQFFTPDPIVNFQCKIVGVDEPKQITVVDPACGSARYLIAHSAFSAASKNKQRTENKDNTDFKTGINLYFGQDIDYLCCLMSVVNMLIHGVTGEVIWGDSLNPSSYNYGWCINSFLQTTGIPHVEELLKEDSIMFQNWSATMERKKQEIEDEEPEEERKVIFKSSDKAEQLSFLF